MNTKIYVFVMFFLVQIPLFGAQMPDPLDKATYYFNKYRLKIMLDCLTREHKSVKLNFLTMKIKRKFCSCCFSEEENNRMQEELLVSRQTIEVFKQAIRDRKQDLIDLEDRWKAER